MKPFNKLLLVIVCFVLLLSFPLVSSDGNVYAASKPKSESKQVHLLMVDRAGCGNGPVKAAFNSVGVKVTTVYSLRKVKPSKYDGLIIPGGANDVDPRLYGAKRSKKTYCPKKKFDKLQINAIRRFVKAGKPVFGICRGFQVINVAYGGTLKQHIPRHSGFRTVKSKKGSWIYKVQGRRKRVFHSHHQTVKKPGKGLVVTAYDMRSGEMEALEHETDPVYAVQWHPEVHMYQQGSRGIFRAFKKICLKYRKADNTLSIRGKTVKVSYNKVKKKAQKLSVKKVISFKHKGKGKVRYTRVSGSKRLSINKKTGSVTVRKGTKKGTYKISVRVRAAGNAKYKSSSAKVITIKVRVR